MIGPSIYGHDDVKKAIGCLLFGGSRKVIDGTLLLLASTIQLTGSLFSI